MRIGIDAPKDIRVVRAELPPKESVKEPAGVVAPNKETRRTTGREVVVAAEGSNNSRQPRQPLASEHPSNQREDDVDSTSKRRTLKDYMSAAHAL